LSLLSVFAFLSLLFRLCFSVCHPRRGSASASASALALVFALAFLSVIPAGDLLLLLLLLLLLSLLLLFCLSSPQGICFSFWERLCRRANTISGSTSSPAAREIYTLA
jgi:hypothetical protein